MGRYDFKSCQFADGKLEIEFEKPLKSIGSGKLHLTKKIIFSRDLQAIDALITLKNTGKAPFDAAYWNWNQLDIPTDEIREDTTFESLGIDSLDIVEMIMDLESELGVELDMEDQKIATFQDLADFGDEDVLVAHSHIASEIAVCM